MKRRLLSAFLAVMMVLTMAPVAFAAEEAGNGDTLKKLFTDVKAGESGSGNVTVTIDIKQQKPYKKYPHKLIF